MKDIRIIELEIFNYCNRRCEWCPNKSKKERQTTYQKMSFNTIKRFIADINKAGYEGYISFSRYNEPMFDFVANYEIFKYIKDNTNCKLVTNTNGDFFRGNQEVLLMACSVFDSITVMNYDDDGQHFDLSVFKEYEIDTENLTFYGKVMDCELLITPKNFEVNDRGGLLEDYSNVRREVECKEPLRFLAIDYNGNVMPCCNMRSDFDEHKCYSYGNINTESILDILEKDYTKSVRAGKVKMQPCEFCIKKPGRHTRDNPGIKF